MDAYEKMMADPATRVRCETINETVEQIARWMERGQGCAALERLRVGQRNAIANKIRDVFSDTLAE